MQIPPFEVLVKVFQGNIWQRQLLIFQLLKQLSIPVYPSLNNMAVNPNASIDVGNMILMVHEYLIGLSGKIGILKIRPTTMAATSASI